MILLNKIQIQNQNQIQIQIQILILILIQIQIQIQIDIKIHKINKIDKINENNEINKINNTNFVMSFSYGRALQQSALKNWSKDIADTNNTQKIFNHRSKMNSLSTISEWKQDLENKLSA